MAAAAMAATASSGEGVGATAGMAAEMQAVEERAEAAPVAAWRVRGAARAGMAVREAVAAAAAGSRAP